MALPRPTGEDRLMVSFVALIARPSSFSRQLLHWLYHLGGPGLILLGFIDNSIVPVTGSMDIITVLLCANQRQLAYYYVIMATIGGVAGGYTTYRLARGDGKGRMSRAVTHGHMKQVKDIFEKWGSAAIVVPAILPPPFPMVPFLIAAGATQYPRGKFLAALAVGRAIRYSILGLLAFLYGRWIITVMREHVYAIICIGLALVLVSITIAFFRVRNQSAYAR